MTCLQSPLTSESSALGLLSTVTQVAHCTTLGDPSFTDYFVDVAPGIVQGYSPSDSPKASCLKRRMQRSEVRGFKAPGWGRGVIGHDQRCAAVPVPKTCLEEWARREDALPSPLLAATPAEPPQQFPTQLCLRPNPNPSYNPYFLSWHSPSKLTETSFLPQFPTPRCSSS